jgi:hypothetical protein
MGDFPADPIRFMLTPGEQRRLERSAFAYGVPLRSAPLLAAAVVALDIVGQFIGHRHSFGHTINLVHAGVAAVGAILAAFVSRRRPIANRCDLAFSDDGLSGTIDGTSAAIRWYDISRVTDIGDAIVIRRTRRQRTIVIPKVQIADCAALWETFQWNLHSPGGIMGIFGARRDIFNYMQPPKRSTAERLNARLVDQRHPKLVEGSHALRQAQDDRWSLHSGSFRGRAGGFDGGDRSVR